ncbi:hypothetical protein KLEP7_gp168 [Pseudaeromonas phage vB_PpeM_ KLEP7]|nr:hypothetical protein KLEP7_gp168 [Pseudaeromonas phage vB_PpeM_ KLEP7]
MDNFIIYGVIGICMLLLTLILFVSSFEILYISYYEDSGYCCYALYTFPFTLKCYMYIEDVERHFLNPKRPTKNELILYQLSGNVEEEDRDKFERIFSKILKG